MNRHAVSYGLLVMLIALAFGCSGGADPLVPAGGQESANTSSDGPAGKAGIPQPHIWGCYDVYLDAAQETITSALNRHVTFAANVVSFLNKKPANLVFNLNSTLIGLR
jgi:hypothetical protein